MPNRLEPRSLIVPALWTLIVVAAIAIGYYFRPIPLPAVTLRWSATDATPVPTSFEVVAFPTTTDVPIYAAMTGDSVVGTLSRALLIDLNELQQSRLSVILADGGEGFVERASLTCDPVGHDAELAAATDFLATAWPAHTDLRRLTLTPVLKGPKGSWSVSSDWVESVRFCFYVVHDDGQVEPLSLLETRRPADPGPVSSGESRKVGN